MKKLSQIWLMLGFAVTLTLVEASVAAPSLSSVTSLADLNEALDQARGKPAVVRVRAAWNHSDTELDKQLASACLRDALSDIVWIEWDVTDNNEADRQFLANYDVFGPPTFLLFDKSGDHLKGQEIVGYLPAEEIVLTLTEVFELTQVSESAECRTKEDAAKAQAWDELIGKSYEYFSRRQKALEVNFGLSEHDRWDIDQGQGTLTLSIGDDPIAEANIAIVGTLIAAHGVWEWSWANPSIDSRLSAPIDVVRRYGTEKRLEKLTDRRWSAEDFDGWEMAVIANYLLQGKGVYSGPAGDLVVFVVITDIRKAK